MAKGRQGVSKVVREAVRRVSRVSENEIYLGKVSIFYNCFLTPLGCQIKENEKEDEK